MQCKIYSRNSYTAVQRKEGDIEASLSGDEHLCIVDGEMAQLVLKAQSLGPNAQKVLLALAERLVVGIPHGDFDKPHDWDKESSEEALDLAVYQAAKLLGLGKAEEPRKHVWGSEFRTIGPDGQQVDSNGRTPDGKPWVPPPGAKLQTAREYTAPDGVRVSLDGRTLDGKPWVPSAGSRVRVVYQPEYGCVDSIVGRTLTVRRVKQVQKPIRAMHDGIVEIEFEGLTDEFPFSRDVRVVPA